jgi:hypothetical protein
LAQAQQALNQLTSPSAIANAQQAVVTAKTNLINAQYVSMATRPPVPTSRPSIMPMPPWPWRKTTEPPNWQLRSDVGRSLDQSDRRQAYRDLYAAQQAYNTALANYNAISRNPIH